MKARSPKGFSLPGLAFLLGKSVHVLCLFLASDVLHSGSLPIITYTFLLLSGSAFLFLLIQRAYSLFPVLSRPQLTAIVTNGVFLASSLLLSSFGLKHCGPIRTLLLDFADHLLLFLPALLCSFSTLTSNRRKGLTFIALAVLILLLTPEVSVHDAPATSAIASAVKVGRFKIAGMVQAGVGGEQEDFGEVAQIAPAKEPGVVGVSGGRLGRALAWDGGSGHSFSFLWLQLSESSVGMLSLILASSISFLRKNYEKRHAKEFGGRKRFHAVSCCAGAALLFPAMALQALFAGASPAPAALSSAHSLGLLSILVTLSFLILFLVVLQFYVDSIAQRSDIQLLTKLNLVISLLCAAAIDWYREEERLSLSTLVASVSIFFGVHYLLSSSSSSSSSSSQQDTSTSLPVYTPTAKPTSTMRSVRLMLKHFLTDPTSLRIFSFLCINFCFMFVELLYGYFSNSLGLISDAGHMLFDCTALAIGLYASYISKVKANSVYTYGYGRYEILSGYVNGVFLLFIGYFILVESVERLFTPPEIRGESLVIVSGLGLCVNLIGLFFFHDHHGGHGHSHGGGGDHGHSHGGAPAEACDDDSHEGHDHGHGGHDADDHGHAHEHHGHSHAAPAKVEKDAGHVNHNILAIYLHILADTLGSVGVIISSLLIQFYHFTSADAICSIIISLLIIGSTGPLLTSTLHILLTRTPARKEKAIQSALSAIQAMPGVTSVRSTHFWLFSDSELVGTLVVGVEGGVDEQAVLVKVSELLKGKRVGVNNLTVQVERDGIGSGAGLLKGLGNGTTALSS